MREEVILVRNTTEKIVLPTLDSNTGYPTSENRKINEPVNVYFACKHKKLGKKNNRLKN